MVRVVEQRFLKKVKGITKSDYRQQEIKRTTVWFLFLPIFIKDEVIKGDIAVK